jgi:integral membrane protein
VSRLTPRAVFRTVAITEAITWIALLVGMFVKYVPETTEVGVQVAGPIHGVAFIAYCLVTMLVAIDQGWSKGRTALGLFSAIPPLMTVWFDRHVERRGGLDTAWHSNQQSERRAQRAVCWLLRNPGKAGASFLVAVAALTGVALLAGPPVG